MVHGRNYSSGIASPTASVHPSVLHTQGVTNVSTSFDSRPHPFGQRYTGAFTKPHPVRHFVWMSNNPESSCQRQKSTSSGRSLSTIATRFMVVIATHAALELEPIGTLSWSAVGPRLPPVVHPGLANQPAHHKASQKPITLLRRSVHQTSFSSAMVQTLVRSTAHGCRCSAGSVSSVRQSWHRGHGAAAALPASPRSQSRDRDAPRLAPEAVQAAPGYRGSRAGAGDRPGWPGRRSRRAGCRSPSRLSRVRCPVCLDPWDTNAQSSPATSEQEGCVASVQACQGPTGWKIRALDRGQCHASRVNHSRR